VIITHAMMRASAMAIPFPGENRVEIASATSRSSSPERNDARGLRQGLNRRLAAPGTLKHAQAP
jgi:hypothetical protein